MNETAEVSAESLRIKVLERMDMEAATYVESVLVLRSRFTGEAPYVGWEGLGLALKQELDDRDSFRAALVKIRDATHQSAVVLRGIAADALEGK